MPDYFQINPAFVHASSIYHNRPSRFLPMNSRPLIKMEIPVLNNLVDNELGFDICTKKIQLIRNCINSQVTFVKFKNSEQNHVLMYDLQNIYQQYFGLIFYPLFKTTPIKESKQMPVEIAYKVDEILRYGGVLLHNRGLVSEQAFVLFLIEILPRLILKFGFSCLTPYGIKILERIHSCWHFQMERNHPLFVFPMIYIELENWISWKDIQTSGLLEYYKIAVIFLSNERVLIQYAHYQQELATNKIADRLLESLVSQNPNSDASEKRFISRNQLYNFLIMMKEFQLPEIRAISQAISNNCETNFNQDTCQTDPLSKAKDQIKAIMQSNQTSQQKNEDMALVLKSTKLNIQSELNNKLKLKQDVLNDAEKKIRAIDESISTLRIVLLGNMNIF